LRLTRFPAHSPLPIAALPSVSQIPSARLPISNWEQNLFEQLPQILKHGVFFVRARSIDELRSVAIAVSWRTMPKPKSRKRLRPRGFFRRWKWVLIPVVVLLLIPAMQAAVVRFIRVKGFASRGLIILLSECVLRLRVAVGERLRVLHRLFDGLEEAVIGA
jgi:hypothetical protein